jgi:hypothetical protein
VCDVAEACTGAGPSCPADLAASNGAVCRPAAGPCDEPEICDGIAVSCPADGFKPQGTVCGDGNGDCLARSICSGDVAACSQSVAKPDGDPCNDPSCNPSAGMCTIGTCKGMCAGNGQVAGAAGRADVVCTLDNLDGDGKATCVAQGFIPTTASLATGALDSGDCVPGCPSATGLPATGRRTIGFGRKTTKRVKLPTNKNGKQYLKDHDTIDMGVCISVTDRAGRVRNQECRALVSPARRRR